MLFIPYELLLQYPTEILSNLLRWLGARHDATTVERAVSNMQFSKLQALEARQTGLIRKSLFLPAAVAKDWAAPNCNCPPWTSFKKRRRV